MSSDVEKRSPQSNDGDNESVQKGSPPASTQRASKRPSSGYQGSGMRPSIITTINNTDPNLSTANYPSILNNNKISRNRKNNEPYESYIEDSFVGHWEHEDDEDDYQEDFDAESPEGGDEDKSDLQHPSTIEFDYDSFGPESFIYTPATATQAESSNNQISTTTTVAQTTGTASTNVSSKTSEDQQPVTTACLASPDSLLSTMTSRPPTLLEVSPELERQHEEEQKLSDSAELSGVPTNDESTKKNRLTRDDSSDRQIAQSSQTIRNLTPQYDLVDPSLIDMKVIEPYKKVISHAGYCHHFDSSMPASNLCEPAPAIIVFSACYLPDRSRRDYNYVMDQLFLYVLTSLHELIADDYILIYLHNTQPSAQTESSKTPGLNNSTNTMASSEDSRHSNNLPTFSWMKRCYQMIDRRLRKNLKILYLVKPTFWLKTIVIMCKPFISAKFSKKLRFVEDMNGLKKCIPIEKLILPASADNI